jgi:hypothetical protein
MKATIIIEQFDNGISIKWSDPDMETDPHDIVALDRDKENAIGKMVWEDITDLMNSELASIVKLTIEYQSIKEKKQ